MNLTDTKNVLVTSYKPQSADVIPRGYFQIRRSGEPGPHIKFGGKFWGKVGVIKFFCVLDGLFSPEGHSIVKIRGVGSIVWGLGFWLGKDISVFFKNIDLDIS